MTNNVNLEVLLDQCFVIEKYPDRMKEMEQMFGPVICDISEDLLLNDVRSYFINNEMPFVHKSYAYRCFG